jgi:outer membrane lipoprotein LolB
MGLQTSGQGFSGRLHWQHTPSHDDISLFSPFGGQVAQIVKTDAQVTLTDDKGRSISASDIKTASSNPVEPQWDAQGRLQSFKQDGWAVKYKSYKQTNGYDLPSKLTLRKEGLYLKLLVETWDIQ